MKLNLVSLCFLTLSAFANHVLLGKWEQIEGIMPKSQKDSFCKPFEFEVVQNEDLITVNYKNLEDQKYIKAGERGINCGAEGFGRINITASMPSVDLSTFKQIGENLYLNILKPDWLGRRIKFGFTKEDRIEVEKYVFHDNISVHSKGLFKFKIQLLDDNTSRLSFIYKFDKGNNETEYKYTGKFKRVD